MVADQQAQAAQQSVPVVEAKNVLNSGDSGEDTSCIRGCCKSSQIRLNVPKAEFLLSQPLAEGSESTVYRASYQDQTVAAKKPKLATAEDINRFHKELQLLLELDHPNIAPLRAARAHPPDYITVFPLFEKGNLAEALHEREWKPTGTATLEIALQVAKALRYVHAKGFVHRDLKPANVLLDENYNAFLSDFGLAIQANQIEHFSKSWKAVGKPTGGFHKRFLVGTFYYMAPEVLKKEVATTKADVYSYAITINELATRTIPYSDRYTDAQCHTVLEMDYSEQQLAAAITVDQLRPVLMTAASRAPPGLASIIERCWHSDPLQRPELEEVIQELDFLKAELARNQAAESGAEMGAEGRVKGTEQTDWRQAAEASVSLGEGTKELASAAVVPAETERKDGTERGYRPTVASGVFETKGARDRMEDTHVAMQDLGGLDGVHLFGIFDGHRGAEAAEFAASAVPRHVYKSLKEGRSAEDALVATFTRTDEQFRREVDARRVLRRGGGKDWHPGCTAVAALVIDDKLVVANAGDCRAVLCRNGKAVQITKDHIAEDPTERARVEAAGGIVEWRVDTWRVGQAAIQVTRSIGDGDLKPAVTAFPEVSAIELTEEDEFLIIASDGLWDVVSNEEALAFVYDTVKDPFLVGKRLATEAITNRLSGDNLTIVIAFLRPVSTFERVY
ncbi:Serine/threonine protein phosphatase [Klebsormidium nitens]|uniref:Serine/threonine protein phosphatase n=1 Tax=Klebsormidium nitens TaxID=105231 RepID=A0A1Y1IPS3_KLENI|nr:Serine/threonine protein phosphatase [Klebsormidium nitens]|eukprot:GAQ90746.1 Serine/threonine protein phosphatase [Klebsormidium nitens]